MNKTLRILLLVVVVVLLGWLAFGGSSEQTTQPAATSTPEFSQQYTASSSPVSFSYPEVAEISFENNSVKVQILGDDNEPNTEITDGLNGYITTKTITQDLQTTAQQALDRVSEQSEGVVQELQSDSFAGRDGFSFKIRTMLGSTSTHYVLSGKDEQALHISYSVAGSKSASYLSTFTDIVETAQITDQAQTPPSDQDGNQDAPSDRGQNPSLASICKSAGGNWLPEHSECEGVQKSWCQEYGGVYESCASACRHDPDAQVCTQQCVRVCEFESGGE